MQITCPKCSAVITDEDAGNFCPECGGELQAAPPPAAATPEPAATPPPAPVSETKFEKTFTTPQGARTFSGNLTQVGQEIAEEIENLDVTSSVFSECRALEVAYNRNLFFLSGSESIMKLRLKPLRDDVQHLVVFMEIQRSGQTTRRQIPVRERLKHNHAFALSVPFNPEQTKGRLSITFYIGSKVGSHDFEYYEFTVEHKVYDDKQSTAALNLTINQDITATHAADVNNRIVSDELSKMAGLNMSVNAMIDRLNDLPPDFVSQTLASTTWRPNLGSGMLHYAERLLLEWNGKKIYLISKPRVTIGRNQLANVDLWLPNATVSKSHADIVYSGDALQLIDHSSYGTYINGRQVHDQEVPLEESAMIEFGDVYMKMNIQKCRGRLQHNICQTCNAPKIKSLTFMHQDKQEYYLLVWECCELGRVIEELSDWTVFSRQGSFLIRTPSQEFKFLRPGSLIEANNRKISVKYYPKEQ